MRTDGTLACWGRDNYGQATPPAGTIVIVKATDPPGGTGFAFTHYIAAPNSFSLDDGGMKTFSNVFTDSYTVIEDDPGVTPGGFVLTGLTCDDPDGGSSVDLGARKATIDLDAGETVTCTFTNTAADADGDGVPDESDLCADTPQGATVDANGCSDAQVDADDDGVCDPDAPSAGPSGCQLDPADNCPDTPNPDQENDVHPGTPEGDHCEDPDDDGDFDIDDNCPDDFNPDQFESEKPPDEWGDVCDPHTQGSSAVSGENRSVSVTHESDTIAFEGTTAEPYQTVTIEDDAAGIGTITVTAKANKGKVTRKFDIVSTSLLTGTVTAVIDFDPAVDERKLLHMRLTKQVTGPPEEMNYSLNSWVCARGRCTKATISFYIKDDATFTVLVPADSDSDGVYDQFDLNDDGDFEDPDELDNCPTIYNPDQTDSDGDTIGDVCDFPVGGIAELPDADASAGRNYVALAGLAAAAVVALSAGGWYGRRRWLS